jgi:hypothetical protein
VRSKPCHFCGLFFCSGFSLKRHMASKHKTEVEEVPATKAAENREDPLRMV